MLRFSYLFYVDLVASTADVNTQNALRHLQARATACAVRALLIVRSCAVPWTRRRWRPSCVFSAASRWTPAAALRLDMQLQHRLQPLAAVGVPACDFVPDIARHCDNHG